MKSKFKLIATACLMPGLNAMADAERVTRLNNWLAYGVWNPHTYMERKREDDIDRHPRFWIGDDGDVLSRPRVVRGSLPGSGSGGFGSGAELAAAAPGGLVSSNDPAQNARVATAWAEHLMPPEQLYMPNGAAANATL